MNRSLPQAFANTPILSRRFEVNAAARPDAIAVTCEGSHLTYAELNRRANQLAHRLRGLGVGPEVLVGVAMERSLDLIVGLLGILKAGGAYLPLDLIYPRERMEFMLSDVGATVVLTTAAARTQLPAHCGITICLDTDWPSIAAEPDTDPEWTAAANDLAYVIYTSGSTGQPKGCQVTQGNVVRLFTATEAWYGFGPDDVWTFFHSHAFDFSVWEIWGALLYGGRVVVVPHLVSRSPQAFHALLLRERVTVLNQTPSSFRSLIDVDAASSTRPDALALRWVIFGGEALDLQMLGRWFVRHGDERPKLVNMYGITETTVHVTFRPICLADVKHGAVSVIGRPLPDLELFVLDEQRVPVADGTEGEIYVGGAGVSRGYLNRKELTAERFIDWCNQDGKTMRLYRTGDRARRLPDGDIEYLGRIDSQVKIRGFRIETGEIENALTRHRGVHSCAVIARKRGAGDARLVAYVVPSATPATHSELRTHLATTLPDYMLPAAIVDLAALPLTANGKLDRNALPEPNLRRPELAVAYTAPVGAIESRVCALFADLAGIERAGRNDNFFDLGGDSLLAVRAVTTLDAGSGALSVIDFFRGPTPAAIAAVLEHGVDRTLAAERMPRRGRVSASEPVAIIAMAGRFPGAPDVEAFWRNLCDGKETITFFRPEELDPGIPPELRDDPDYVRARGIIDGVENFDAAFFGITPREAELMDPQQRLFLELCWECLERGGYVPDAHKAPVGVFGGMHNATYFQHHVSGRPDLVGKLGAFQVMLGNEKDFIATRVAHRLNLTGPAINVQSACSTSLVAICQAFDALRYGQCDMALAGGASVTCPPRSGYIHQEGTMLSPDGHTRTFDADAQGTVFSDGVAVVLLKRLPDALADGDPIYAVMRGGAINNDGAVKASFTAPSSAGQAAVIAAALDNAGVDARSISYVEAHGTATPLGDPIEIEGLTAAFRRSTDDRGFCAIGSVKSNVGHLVIAAGAAGVIKTALALSERRLPPSLHFSAGNPKIDFVNSPFVVNDRLVDWRDDNGAPRRAGVSSFGVGGTNAHVILEEPPARPSSEPAVGPQLLLLSARSPEALKAAARQLGVHLAAHPDSNLADVAHTLAVGRKAFAHRAHVVATGVEEAIAQLGDENFPASAPSVDEAVPELVFMFPGQGAQYAGMGRQLYATEPAFRIALDECAEILHGENGFDLRGCLFGDDADALRETAVTQPATFAIEYALAKLWISLGIRPAAMIGHSVGEFTAAVIAGVMSLADGMRLVARRGQLMQAQPAGSMLSVRLDAKRLNELLPVTLALAAENAPNSCVVAGEISAIEAFRAELEGTGIASRVLQTSHAFHSSMMDPVLEPFRGEVAGVTLGAPSIPIASTLTGAMLDDAEAISPDYWARHLRGTVRFSAALRSLLNVPQRVFLEVGPRATLSTLSRQHPEGHHRAVVPSLADSLGSERTAWLAAAGRLWCWGAPLALDALDRRTRKQRLRLPTYPFERKRYWVEAGVPAKAVQPAVPDTAPAANDPLAAGIARVPISEGPMMVANPSSTGSGADRPARLLVQLKGVFEDVAGIDLAEADPAANFIEFGLDSLSLTQVSLQLQKTFGLKITFRELMESCSTLERLAMRIDQNLPPDAATAQPAAVSAAMTAVSAVDSANLVLAGKPGAADTGLIQQVIQQQIQIMQQQIALLGATGSGAGASAGALPAAVYGVSVTSTQPPSAGARVPVETAGAEEEATLAHKTYDVKKAFGAIARIHSGNHEITSRQRARLQALIRRYVARTQKSKEYTRQHRSHMADPRVVNGFRPLLKEIVYQIVVERSMGSRLWDIDGNEYVDALNGFGMNLFGWQPDFVLDAVRRQLDLGYEIGPQHPLAGEVADLICGMTGFERAAFCNTGSEAVMGTVRVARTVTGRDTLVIFSGSYHGIFDEVIVRGTRTLRSVPAAPGILRNTAEHVLVLDYGTPETLAIIKERAHEIAAVLVEPVQSRRPDFQPREFLKELRIITQDAGALLIFDEVVTGFRAHPRGAQHVLGIDADLASYGKVIGGGLPIGVIAGKREYMDALDGGQWQFGDDSIPTVGVTYFAGTFVRHPLALAAARAVLQHLKEAGPALQERLNACTATMMDEMNTFCSEVGAPIKVTHFSSVWRINFTEDHALQDLLFVMMRSRGIHILDHFPCFFTTAHNEADFAAITKAFKDSVLELQEAEFLPRRRRIESVVFDAAKPPVPGARLGKDANGQPAWFVPNPRAPGKFKKVNA